MKQFFDVKAFTFFLLIATFIKWLIAVFKFFSCFSSILELLSEVVFNFFDNLRDKFVWWDFAFNPAGMISNDVFVKYLTDSNYFSINTVFIEILIDTQVNLNLLDSILSLVEDMLYFKYFPKASLSKQSLLIE